jgi:hypothetical protein
LALQDFVCKITHLGQQCFEFSRVLRVGLEVNLGELGFGVRIVGLEIYGTAQKLSRLSRITVVQQVQTFPVICLSVLLIFGNRLLIKNRRFFILLLVVVLVGDGDELFRALAAGCREQQSA